MIRDPSTARMEKRIARLEQDIQRVAPILARIVDEVQDDRERIATLKDFAEQMGTAFKLHVQEHERKS